MSSAELLLGHLGDLQFEDDLNMVLQWLSPQEHQSRPPSLRVRTAIKTIMQHANEPFNDGLCLYYYDLVRKECLSLTENNPTTFTYSQLIKLENKLYYPLEFIPILKGTSEDHSLDHVLFSVRHYIMDTNKNFRNKLKERIQHLIEEEDYDICQTLIQWIDDSRSTEFNAKGLVLDILLNKIEDICKQEMVKLWKDHQVVEYTYGQFMKNSWPGFQQLLGIPEDQETRDVANDKDTSIPQLIHDHFEKQFINIRMTEILYIITNCAKAGSTLCELRPLVKKYNLINKLVAAFLSQFQKLIVESPKTTAEILQIFIMAIDVFIYLDIRDHYLRVLTTFMKPFLLTRENFISSYLYASLGLKSKEFKAFDIEKPEGVTKLRHALKGNHLFQFTSSNAPASSEVKNMKPHKTELKSEMLIFDVLRQYKAWVPDGLTINPGDDVNLSSSNSKTHPESHVLKGRSNLITDCILSLTEDKESLVTLLLHVFTLRLLKFPSRKLERKYLIVYLRLYQRIKNGHNLLLSNNDIPHKETDNKLFGRSTVGNLDDIDSELIVDDGFTKRYNDRIGYMAAIDEEDEIFVKFNKISVMLGDMRESDLMDRFIKQVKPKIAYTNDQPEDSGRIYPKFISSFYWDMKKQPHNETGEEDKFKISTVVEDDILMYTRGYRRLHPERLLKYYKDETIFTLKITDSRKGNTSVHTVTRQQYSVIQKFGHNLDCLTLEALADKCNATTEDVQKAAQYWVDNKLLRFDGKTYYAFDRIPARV